MQDQADVGGVAGTGPPAGSPVERYVIDGNEYLLRSTHAQPAPAVRFEVVVKARQPQEGQTVERLVTEIAAADQDQAREVFWRRLAMALLDDPERVAYAEVGLERVAMVRDIRAARWHVGVIGARARAEVSPYSDPAEAMRAWLGHVQALVPR